MYSPQHLIWWHSINSHVAFNRYLLTMLLHWQQFEKKIEYFIRIPHLNILWNCHNFHSDMLCLCFSTCLHMPYPRASWLKWKPVCNLMRLFSSQWRILLLISFFLPQRQSFSHSSKIKQVISVYMSFSEHSVRGTGKIYVQTVFWIRTKKGRK